MSAATPGATAGDEVARFDEHRDSLTAFLASDADGSYYVGHACVLVRIKGRKYLFDPVTQRSLLLDSWLYFPPQVMDPRLLDVDAVFISHFHEDHYDPRFLTRLRPGTPVYVCRGRALITEMLEGIGANVRHLEPKTPQEVAPGVVVYGIPSDYNLIDSSFLIRGNDLGVYQGNDNFVSAETIAAARDAVGPIDHAFVPYAYIWWYPFCLRSIDDATRASEGERLISKYLNLALAHARVLDSPIVVPCGGNLIYYNAVSSPINDAVYSPCDFAEYARERDPAVAERVLPLMAGDYVLKVDGRNTWTGTLRTAAEYQAAAEEFLRDHFKRNPERVPERRPLAERDLAFLRARLARPEVASLDYTLVFQRADAPEIGLRVDLRDKTVAVGTAVDEARPWLRFELDPTAFGAWLREEVIFEVVLESARFAVHRWPERHDPAVWEQLRIHF